MTSAIIGWAIGNGGMILLLSCTSKREAATFPRRVLWHLRAWPAIHARYQLPFLLFMLVLSTLVGRA